MPKTGSLVALTNAEVIGYDIQTPLINRVTGDGAGVTIEGVLVEDGNLDLITANKRIDFEGNRFVHNFQHPTGGGAIPVGQNTWLGQGSGNYTTGSTATVTSHGSYSVGVGAFTLASNTTGYAAVALGHSVLNLNTTGYFTTGVGHAALASNTTGYQNAALGAYALNKNISGYRNAAVGYDSGRFISGGVTSAEASLNSVFIGYKASPLADGETNQIVIGADTTGVGSNSVVLGNSSIAKTVLRGNVGIGTESPAGFLRAGQSLVVYNETTNGGVSITSGSTSANQGPLLDFLRIHNDDSTVGINDDLGTISFRAHNGTSKIIGASIFCEIDSSTPTTSSMPTRLSLFTTPIGSNTQAERMRVDNAGLIGMNCTPTARLHVNAPSGNTSNILQLDDNSTELISVSSDGHMDFVADNLRIDFQGVRMLHTYSDPVGGTAIPSGWNVFLGGNSGNLTVGSTATSTGQASFNVGVGYASLLGLTTGYRQTAVGAYALANITTGYYSVAVGYEAGRFISGGSDPNTGSINSVFLGHLAIPQGANDSNSVVIGASTTGAGSNSVVLGNSSIATTVLRGNVGIGGTPSYELDVIRSDASSTYARVYNSNASAQSVGYRFKSSLREWVNYTDSTGRFVLYDATAPRTAIVANTDGSTVFRGISGQTADMLVLEDNAGNDLVTWDDEGNQDFVQDNLRIDFQGNRFIHAYRGSGGAATPVGDNTFLGIGVANVSTGNSATSSIHGSYNSGYGARALEAINNGYSNTAIGTYALRHIVDTNNAVAVGSQAGRFISGGSVSLTSAEGSVFIGSATKANADGESNQIAIGYNVTGVGSNSVVLGNSSISTTVLRGSVGIGTESPASNQSLHIISTVNNRGMVLDTTQANVPLVFNSQLATAGKKAIAITSNATNNTLIFQAYNDDFTWQKNIAYFKHDGEVGIGATVPTARLHVNAPSGNTSNIFQLDDNGTAKVMVDDAGKLGVGASPTYFIDFSDDSAGTTTLRLQNTNATPRNVGFRMQNAGAEWQSYVHSTGSYNIYDHSTGSSVVVLAEGAPANSLYVNSSGNVGIGTESPGYGLDVVSTSGFLSLSDNKTDATLKTAKFVSPHYTNSEEPFIGATFVANNGSNRVSIGGSSSAGNAATEVSFYSAANSTTLTGTRRMTIDSAGKVGVGSTFPSSLLHVNAPAANTSNILQLDDNGTECFSVDDNRNVTITTDTTTGYALDVQAANLTTGNGLRIVSANALTTGKLAYIHSSSADTSVRSIVNIINDNPAATGARCLEVRNDYGAGDALTIKTEGSITAGITGAGDLMTSGGRKIAHVAKTSGPYTATTSDHVILCDGTSGSFTINLPAVATSDKVTYFIKHISTGANTITVDGNASETIDNATTQALPAGTAITIVCDGTEWHII